MKKCFKHNDFLHHEYFTTAITIFDITFDPHIVDLLSKLNSIGSLNSSICIITFKLRITLNKLRYRRDDN